MILADVAGHDMGASYHTVLIKSFFDVNCRLGNSGEDFMRVLNQELYKDGTNERMVCALFGRINLLEMWMETVSAAHPYILHMPSAPEKTSDSVPRKRYGAPLGMLEPPILDINRVKINPGDRIFIYSDGLPDAKRFDPATQQKLKLGDDGVKELIKRHSAKPLASATEAVWNDAMKHCGEKASDDMILLGVEILL